MRARGPTRGPTGEKTEKLDFRQVFVVAPYGDSGGFGTTELSGNILFCVEIDPGSPIFCLIE